MPAKCIYIYISIHSRIICTASFLPVRADKDNGPGRHVPVVAASEHVKYVDVPEPLLVQDIPELVQDLMVCVHNHCVRSHSLATMQQAEARVQIIGCQCLVFRIPSAAAGTMMTLTQWRVDDDQGAGRIRHLKGNNNEGVRDRDKESSKSEDMARTHADRKLQKAGGQDEDACNLFANRPGRQCYSS